MNENGDFKSEYKGNEQPFNGHLKNVDIHFQSVKVRYSTTRAVSYIIIFTKN